MQHTFGLLPKIDIARSSFNRSHNVKTTLDAGKLIPFYIDEVYPGDTFNADVNIFARQNTPVVPVLDNAYLDTFYFFVPYRLLWKHWKEFNGENPLKGIQSKEYIVPQAKGNDVAVGTLWDYFGFPTGVKGELSVSCFPFRAYWKIWNEWFRDENLQDMLSINSGSVVTATSSDDEFYGYDSDVSVSSVFPLYRGKRHDYFTSALPWPQKGAGVELPLGATASVSGHIDIPGQPVKFDSYVASGSAPNPGFYDRNWPAGTVVVDSASGSSLETAGRVSLVQFHRDKGHALKAFGEYRVDGQQVPLSGGNVDLSQTTAVTINSLRQAFALQRFYERDARGGTRYTEIIRSHFGVVSPDSRLQRPEYLGGSSTPIIVNPVMQTSETTQSSPQGNLSAYAYANSTTHGFRQSFTEHGIVMGLMNIRTDLSYQQGINRQWKRRTRTEFYWPSFAHLGEQVVFNEEIYAQGNEKDKEAFGYQERYAECRFHPSIITGQLRSTFAQSLDVWHYAQKFDSLPALNEDFIADKASEQGIRRSSAVQNQPQFYVDCYLRLICARPMPVYGIPDMGGRF